MRRLLESREVGLVVDACSCFGGMERALDSLDGYIIGMTDVHVARAEMWKRSRKIRRLLIEARAHLSNVVTGLEDMERAVQGK